MKTKRTEDDGLQRGHERKGSGLWLGKLNHMNLHEFFLSWVSLHGNGVLEKTLLPIKIIAFLIHQRACVNIKFKA